MNPYQEQKGKVYFFTDGEYIKIGYTSESLTRRIKRLSTGSSRQLYILGFFYGNIKDETRVHHRFAPFRLRENAEWFSPDQSILDFINEVNIMEVYVDFLDGKLTPFKAIRLVGEDNTSRGDIIGSEDNKENNHFTYNEELEDDDSLFDF